MQPRKSQRHVRAANARWRAAEQRAQAERDEGIPDRADADCRQPFDLLLRAAGYRDLRIEPRRGYVAWRAVDAQTGEVLHSAALKELLHWIADEMPRMLAARNFQ
jgi:hypothetical protein